MALHGIEVRKLAACSFSLASLVHDSVLRTIVFVFEITMIFDAMRPRPSQRSRRAHS